MKVASPGISCDEDRESVCEYVLITALAIESHRLCRLLTPTKLFEISIGGPLLGLCKGEFGLGDASNCTDLFGVSNGDFSPQCDGDRELISLPDGPGIIFACSNAKSSCEEAASFATKFLKTSSDFICPLGSNSAKAPRSTPRRAAHSWSERISMAPNIGNIFLLRAALQTACSASSVFPLPKGPTNKSKPPRSACICVMRPSTSLNTFQAENAGTGETPPQAIDRAGHGKGTGTCVFHGSESTLMTGCFGFDSPDRRFSCGGVGDIVGRSHHTLVHKVGKSGSSPVKLNLLRPGLASHGGVHGGENTTGE
mmetsp:Transcript_92075/g.145623  ORF Transcript_92075/g.145623 Transcript_92075/m.145623 type:complete len:311 (-) Transcript_92075:111-1043(-)